MKEGADSFLLLACMDLEDAFALPYHWITNQKQFLNMTQKGERSYWHIAFAPIDQGGLAINLSRKKEKISLAQFQYSLMDKKLEMNRHSDANLTDSKTSLKGLDSPSE